MIKIVKGDLLTANGIIAHGVNCVGGFGSGVAGQIARQFPIVREFYLHKHNNGGWKLGEIQVVTIAPDLMIVNCATQEKFLPRDTVHCDYTAIGTVMHNLKHLSNVTGMKINLPKIGCGLAGGDWNKVSAIIDDVFWLNDKDITVWEL